MGYKKQLTMDIFEKPQINIKDKIELNRKWKREFNLINSVKKVNGHILFSYNVVTKEIKVADVVKSNTVCFLSKKPIYKDKIVIEKDCYYEQALNKNNFIKRLKKKGLIK